MGTVRSALAGAIILLAMIAPHRAAPALAQATPQLSCNGTLQATPMPGHYTGAWHSTSNYQFDAKFNTFETIIQIPMTIDGTLDFTVYSNGQISGTASGKVNAPVLHDGEQDISSGYGTISGQINGVVTPGSSLLVLSHPLIDMFWGTFGGGTNGHVERTIQMPDYQFPVSGMDCVSSKGTISEQGFPTQWIVPDGSPDNGAIAVPGVGSATGTWQITSDGAATFNTLSQRVDTFISQANALLNGPASGLTPTSVTQTVIQPLQGLLTDINQNPNVAPCLLQRIGAWEKTALPLIFQRAQSLVSSPTLAGLRQSGDLLRMAQSLNASCNLPDGGAAAALNTAEKAALDRAMNAQSWADAALFAREILLTAGSSGQAGLQAQLNADLHALIQASDSHASLDAGRMAYALGDDSDAGLVARSINAHSWSTLQSVSNTAKKKKRKPKPKRTPTPRPTATPTPTPVPKTTDQILAAGLKGMTMNSSGGSTPTFSWQPVSGATRYVVVVTGSSGPAWIWSGAAVSVPYGDTAIDGTPGTQESWPIALPNGATWSVLALDAQGKIVGARMRSAL